MATRISPRHDLATREKIKTSQLVNRLQGFALEEDDPQTGKPIVMSKERVNAAIALLKKTLPDLVATTLSGDPDNPVQTSHIISFKAVCSD